jgi:tRNA threonylcarbamoyladenosine biosynthesis protein TsaE
MELSSIKDTQNLAKKISKIIKNGHSILLHGEIGVGKTTFVRFLINHLEVENKINKSNVLSPTFNIVYDYNIGKIKILHYDLYRIKSYNDILELGMYENEKSLIKIIEWPELLKPKPIDRIEVSLQYSKSIDSRLVNVSGFGKLKDCNFNEI